MRKNKFEITDEDVELLIKMENLIGCNERKIFDDEGNFYHEERHYPLDGSPSYLTKEKITNDDFWEFWKFIDRVMLAREDDRSQNYTLKGKNKKKFIKGKL